MSSQAESIFETGMSLPEMGGIVLVAAVALAFVISVGLTAKHFKGRSFILWSLIAILAQSLTFAIPVSILVLLGAASPNDVAGPEGKVGFDSFRLLAEMSIVTGLSNLALVGLLDQTRWKACPACNNHIPWRAKTCPHCAANQIITPNADKKMDPGAYPRFASRMIHLPIELDRRLRDLAKPIRQNGKLTEEAAVSQLVRDVLLRVEAELQDKEKTD